MFNFFNEDMVLISKRVSISRKQKLNIQNIKQHTVLHIGAKYA